MPDGVAPEPEVVARPYAPAVVIVKRAPPEAAVTEAPEVESFEPEREPARRRTAARARSRAAPETNGGPARPVRSRANARRRRGERARTRLRRRRSARACGARAAVVDRRGRYAAGRSARHPGLRAFRRYRGAARARRGAHGTPDAAGRYARGARDDPPVRARAGRSVSAVFPAARDALDERELGALRTVLERDLDDVFLRGLQVLLAIAPRALEGVGLRSRASAVDAMAAYRGAAGAWLMRVTVRRAVDRRYDPLTAADASLHEAGRKLVAALRGSFG